MLLSATFVNPKFLLAVTLCGLAASLVACTAELEPGCLSGECATPGAGGASSSTTSSTTASQGGGGSGGGGVACLSCLPVADMRTGALPCDVEKVIVDKCQRCHTEPQKSGAPFPLLTYENTQALYVGDAIFLAMEHQVRLGTMPLNPPKLTPDEKQTMLAWLCSCAPPAPEGTTCP